MGRKKRCAYWMKAMRTPRVTVPKNAAEPVWQGGCVLRPGHGVAKDGDAAAEPDDERDGDGAEEFDDGVVERVGEDRVGPGDLVFGVDGCEVVEGALLAVEELHDGHAGDVLLGEGVDAGDGGAQAAVAVADVFAEDSRDEENGGDDGEGEQRERPAHAQHDDDDEGERRRRLRRWRGRRR